MRILITGATGLVGNNCLRLLDSGLHELSVLVRAGHDARPFEGLNVCCVLGDLSEPAGLESTIPDVDVIIHAAADTHIGKRPRPAQRTVNVEATRVIAKVARAKCSKLVFVSSVDALPAGSPDGLVDEETVGDAKYPCEYVATKRAAEWAVFQEIENGLNAVIVNPGFMLGPWDWKPSSGRMLVEVATGFTPFAPKGGFSVCDVRDVAAAICKAATSETERTRYILAGNNIRYIEAWRIFANVSGTSPPICPAGPLMRIVAGKWGDAISKLTGKEGDVNSAAIGMSNLYHYYDSKRAKTELDYRIRTVEESARAAWDRFTENKYV